VVVLLGPLISGVVVEAVALRLLLARVRRKTDDATSYFTVGGVLKSPYAISYLVYVAVGSMISIVSMRPRQVGLCKVAGN
jgi:hypothetical protein